MNAATSEGGTEPVPPSAIPRTVLVTNDFPPRAGGIQTFVHGLAAALPPDALAVYASRSPGATEFDRTQPYRIVRDRSAMLLPTPRVASAISALARDHGAEVGWFGAMAPLALLAPALRRAGVHRIVAQTHGHEVGWAMLPGARAALRSMARSADVVTCLGEFTGSRLGRALPAGTDIRRLVPGVDTDTFTPDADGAAHREVLGLAGRPIVVCVSRLVPRKGQDMLIRALAGIRDRARGAALVLVGGGPDAPRLQRLAASCGVTEHVRFTGSVSAAELPSWYAVGDVFAMPARSRRAGLDVEGLGIVALEAAACGLPAVVGSDGGAPDSVLNTETGVVVDGRDVAALTAAVGDLLADPARARAMGIRGREWIEAEWTAQAAGDRLAQMLNG